MAEEAMEKRTPVGAFAGAVGFAVTVLALSVLYYGKDFLIPVAIAIVVWYLINALATALERVPILSRLPRWTFMAFALLIILFLSTAVGRLIGANVSDMIDGYPAYRDHLVALADKVSARIGLPVQDYVENFFKEFDFRPWIASIASGLTSVLGTLGLVVTYVAFMLVEQTRFSEKLAHLASDPARLTAIKIALARMQRQIETYVWVKTFASLLTGLASWVVLVLVGVDNAPFWALLAFLLNYIPTIGSILGVVLPALMALVQFDTLTPFLIVTGGLGIAQFLTGNVLEPPLMGETLNISPLVVMLSLVLWGMLWGLAGMFLCVPITVILLIVLAQFPATRGIAVLLSGTGRV
ncbi:MAG: AI-2E family transporter [Alphaproteobacteria bacterium]|nr:AI-2E family transporter [Alphaproteobacteria bacterium]